MAPLLKEPELIRSTISRKSAKRGGSPLEVEVGKRCLERAILLNSPYLTQLAAQSELLEAAKQLEAEARRVSTLLNGSFRLLPDEFGPLARAASSALELPHEVMAAVARLAKEAKGQSENLSGGRRSGRGRSGVAADFVRLMLEHNPDCTRDPHAWINLEERILPGRLFYRSGKPSRQRSYQQVSKILRRFARRGLN